MDTWPPPQGVESTKTGHKMGYSLIPISVLESAASAYHFCTSDLDVLDLERY
ncbi:uncharacterized protein G2W53_006874 [Senna tora]|uniref:Uncharacterized protein n=1 Tax=Senna tora TaxID=362788 RepID=A0A834X5Y4_9FABA|nr:uncharacterized protein G2W53_006874 [Senna tora]